MSVQAPLAPKSVSETGIDGNFLLTLMVKAVHVYGLSDTPEICGHVKLSRAIVSALLDDAREMGLIEFLGTANRDGGSEMRYALTGKGHTWAADALAHSAYAGPAPVTLADFSVRVGMQDILNEKVNRAALEKSLSHLVLPEDLVDHIGPAANSGKSILLYGTPGNGKTCIAEAIGHAFSEPIYLPYCMVVDNQIIKVYDETVHKVVEASAPPAGANGEDPEAHESWAQENRKLDQRWVRCHRPVVVTGGELTLGMLDLTFNPVSKFYEAPMQLKATGGVFIIDDFGRQQTPPQEILNRWIIPLERGVDYLTLHTGKKFPVPFNGLVMFSTNIPPAELADDATMRRLYYKLEIPVPTREDYTKIFENTCERYSLPLPGDLIPFMLETFYSDNKYPLAGYHPEFLVQQIIAMCDYKDVPAQISQDLITSVWPNLYAS